MGRQITMERTSARRTSPRQPIEARTSTLNNKNIGCHECRVTVSHHQDDGSPKFRTSMMMLQKMGKIERKMGVVLSIYSTNFDLYAVVSQDRNIIVKDCGYIKLRNCTVTTDMNSQTLEIVQKNYEGVPLRFRAHKQEHLREIVNLLHLNSDDDIFNNDTLPSLSSSPISASNTGVAHLGVKKFLRSSSPVSCGSPRVSPNAKRKLSMPVLAEDDELETIEQYSMTSSSSSPQASSLSLNESCDSEE